MDDEPMWAADHVVALTLSFAITIPETANEFAIKGNNLTLVKGTQFDGRTKTDPHKHILDFFEISDMFKYRDTKNEVVRLMMFPLSLTGEVKTWLDELNEGTIKTIVVIDKILEEDFDALLDEGSKILHSIEGILLEEEIFAEFDEFMAMTVDKNYESESDTKEPPFKKITINKIKTSLEEPPTNLELKPLPDNLEYVFLKEPSFLPVSPIHCVPKKGGIIVVTNKNDELVRTRAITGWRVCIDYRKLNKATTKDHFLLPFMDQMLERLTGNKHFCFLDGFSGYFQIPINPIDQEKTAFTCPFGTYAYRRIPFGLCNAPSTFQRCMLVIFHDMIEEFVKVFMDDFSVFGDSFDKCLNNLDKMFQRCKDAHLVLN
nr:reverse transcriptase domain-containing protein [Tanacetum cinerariifolium]